MEEYLLRRKRRGRVRPPVRGTHLGCLYLAVMFTAALIIVLCNLLRATR